ncbi:ATP-dependent RNA helicase DDX24 [Plecturocebus cupreus]
MEMLTDTKIHYETDKKGFYLYYFLMQYPDLNLVFAKNISDITHLSRLLKVLNATDPIYSHAPQDLDIPKVQHVICYQVHSILEIYIYSSLRTTSTLRRFTKPSRKNVHEWGQGANSFCSTKKTEYANFQACLHNSWTECVLSVLEIEQRLNKL